MRRPLCVLASKLGDDATLAEAPLKYTLQAVLNERPDDMAFFEERIEKGVIVKLQAIVDTPFVRMDYTDAINILSSAKAKFEFPVTWGMDLQSEHERYLAEQHVRGPLVRLTEERVGPPSVAFFLSGALTSFSAAIPFQLA